MNAVEQFGPPSLFRTISPFEWTFPCPPWLDNLRSKTGKSQKHPTLEKLHIVHVLEQLVRGYLCGSNTNRWKKRTTEEKYEGSRNKKKKRDSAGEMKGDADKKKKKKQRRKEEGRKKPRRTG